MASVHKILETQRFTLKPLDQSNAPQFADLGADSEIVKTLMSDWSTPEKRLEIAKSWIEGSQEYGIWGVFDRDENFGESDSFIGFCGVEKPLPAVGMGPSIYYAFSRITWGFGVASEIVNAIVEYQFRVKGVGAIEALVYSGLNPASARVLEKNGMSLIGRHPLAEYVAEECMPTMRYELWRVENAVSQNAQQCLQDAAFKIGQFVGDKVSTRDEMFKALKDAAAVNKSMSSIGTQSVATIIAEYLDAGMSEKGWLYYRIEKKDLAGQEN